MGSMIAVGAMVVGAYLALALGMGGVGGAAIAFVTCALACATWMCAWQARNHDLQRRELGRVSRSDPLTECLNRRGFEERFAAELQPRAPRRAAAGHPRHRPRRLQARQRRPRPRGRR